ncbi:MAG: hypothetical protein JW727_01770 [Candidatus Aenigmarchaeota archaeon]|nr:hypothetical protein [Candidatus Aenigmarchaeota archaeon]
MAFEKVIRPKDLLQSLLDLMDYGASYSGSWVRIRNGDYVDFSTQNFFEQIAVPLLADGKRHESNFGVYYNSDRIKPVVMGSLYLGIFPVEGLHIFPGEKSSESSIQLGNQGFSDPGVYSFIYSGRPFLMPEGDSFISRGLIWLGNYHDGGNFRGEAIASVEANGSQRRCHFHGMGASADVLYRTLEAYLRRELLEGENI